MHLRKLLVATLVAFGLATAASAATVTFTLDKTVPGEFKVFAESTAGDNFGLAGYGLVLDGTVTTLDHNSPKTAAGQGSGGFGPAGFTVLRSADGAGTLLGGQDTLTPTPNLIRGFGQSANSFAGLGINSFDPTAEGVTWEAKLLIAQGTYTGTLTMNEGAFDTFANVFTAAQGQEVAAATEDFCDTSVETCGGPVDNLPPVVTDHIVPGYNANLPGDPQTLTHQFAVVDPDAGQTHAWDQLTLVSYTANYGGVGPGPLTAPTLGAGGLFSWVSEGSPRGDYIWSVRATDNGTPALSDTGTITVNVTGVPEPSTLALFGLAMVGGLGMIRRRNG